MKQNYGQYFTKVVLESDDAGYRSPDADSFEKDNSDLMDNENYTDTLHVDAPDMDGQQIAEYERIVDAWQSDIEQIRALGKSMFDRCTEESENEGGRQIDKFLNKHIRTLNVAIGNLGSELGMVTGEIKKDLRQSKAKR